MGLGQWVHTKHPESKSGSPKRAAFEFTGAKAQYGDQSHTWMRGLTQIPR
jgi:hypothetical protein